MSEHLLKIWSVFPFKHLCCGNKISSAVGMRGPIWRWMADAARTEREQAWREASPVKSPMSLWGWGGLLYIWSCEHKLSWLVKANRSGSDVQWGWSWTWAHQQEMEIIGWWLERIIQNPLFMQLDTNLLHCILSKFQIMRLVYVQLITGAKSWLKKKKKS